jgi:periplasmic protein TonB
MEEALQQMEAAEQVNTTHLNYFAIGITASVILHLICTVILFAVPEGSPPSQSVTYVDLSLPQQAAPIRPTAPQAAPKVAPHPTPPQVAPQPAPPEMTEKSAAEEAEPQPRVQQAKEVAAQPPATPQPASAVEERSHTTFGLGLTKGYFKGLRDGETLIPVAKEYFLQQMLPAINEKWWLDEKIDKKNAAPLIVNIVVARNGEIVSVVPLNRSENPGYDRAVLAALKATGPLPPLPAEFEGEYFQGIVTLVPPLNLMSW